MTERAGAFALALFLAVALSPVFCCCAMRHSLDRLAGAPPTAVVASCCVAAPASDGGDTRSACPRESPDGCPCKMLVSKASVGAGVGGGSSVLAPTSAWDLAPAAAPDVAQAAIRTAAMKIPWRHGPPGPPIDPVSRRSKLVI